MTCGQKGMGEPVAFELDGFRVWKHRIERLNEAIRSFRNRRFRGDEICEVLPKLPRIPVDRAIRWSRDEEVRCHLRGPSSEPRIRDIYAAEFIQEPGGNPQMEPLAHELTNLLKKRVRGNDAAEIHRQSRPCRPLLHPRARKS
jgi:hypothetical protein